MIAWLVILAGVALTGVGVVAGVATLHVRRVELYRWAAEARPGHGAAGTLLAAPERVLRTANALASFGALACGAGVAALVSWVPAPLAVVVASLVAVPLAVIAGVSVPRAVALRWAEAIIPQTVPGLARLAWVLVPLGGGGGARAADQMVPSTSDELGALSGVDAFTQRPVREVMTPRTEIVAVREGASISEVGRVFADSGYSRIPIYHDTLDDIVGMIYAFDLLKIGPGAELPVRPLATAPTSKRCAELLFEMQRERRHLAVVLDEFGGTAGIVTLEDLLEELVGEIFDEYDAATVATSAPALYEATGATSVEELVERFGVVLPEASETVSGLLSRAAGRIPGPGERFALDGLEFDVIAATPNRIERVLVRRGPIRTQHLDTEPPA